MKTSPVKGKKPKADKGTPCLAVRLGAMVTLPFDVVTDARKRRLADECTVTPLQHSVSFGKQSEPPQPIQQFVVHEASREVSVPFRWGVEFLKEAAPFDAPPYALVEDFSDGAFQWKSPRLPDPNHPRATPGQAQFFADISAALSHNHAILIEGPTGGGKTVSMLNEIGLRGVPALVIVPSKALADQWKLEAIKHLGLEDEDVAIMQGARLNWRGFKIVIAVIHNLFLKEFTQEFYDNFGLVCWDEAHRLGAPEFCKTMPLFRARWRIAATATPDRKDGCMDLVLNHFGEVAAKMQAEALACECRVIRHNDPFARKIAHLPPPTILKIITKHKGRNELIADTVHIAWKRGRKMLVLSDRIEHLQTLQMMLVARGVPLEQTGLYVGSYKANGRMKPTGQGYLRAIREDPKFRLIFATYAMMKEGTDIPSLDAGMDATPRADGVQAIGRIRRPLPGKPVPVWFTLIDEAIPIFVAYARARLRDYAQCNVTIIDKAA